LRIRRRAELKQGFHEVETHDDIYVILASSAESGEFAGWKLTASSILTIL
jgi:hypothetical protein